MLHSWVFWPFSLLAASPARPTAPSYPYLVSSITAPPFSSASAQRRNKGPAVLETGPSSPVSGLLSSSSALAPCAGGPSPQVRRRPPSGGRQPAPLAPSSAIGGLRGDGRASASASRPPSPMRRCSGHRHEVETSYNLDCGPRR